MNLFHLFEANSSVKLIGIVALGCIPSQKIMFGEWGVHLYAMTLSPR